VRKQLPVGGQHCICPKALHPACGAAVHVRIVHALMPLQVSQRSPKHTAHVHSHQYARLFLEAAGDCKVPSAGHAWRGTGRTGPRHPPGGMAAPAGPLARAAPDPGACQPPPDPAAGSARRCHRAAGAGPRPRRVPARAPPVWGPPGCSSRRPRRRRIQRRARASAGPPLAPLRWLSWSCAARHGIPQLSVSQLPHAWQCRRGWLCGSLLPCVPADTLFTLLHLPGHYNVCQPIGK